MKEIKRKSYGDFSSIKSHNPNPLKSLEKDEVELRCTKKKG